VAEAWLHKLALEVRSKKEECESSHLDPLMNPAMLAVRMGGGDILIILLCLIGLALVAAIVVGAVFLIVRGATRGRDTEKRLQTVEAELRELNKSLPPRPGSDLKGSVKKGREPGR